MKKKILRIMSPPNYEVNVKQDDGRCWCFDEKQGQWKLLERQSSFSELNRLALRGTENVVNANDYTNKFRRYVKNETKKLRDLERQRRSRNKTVLLQILSLIWRYTFARLGEDWICLALLGIFMAVLSVGVDEGVEWCYTGK